MKSEPSKNLQKLRRELKWKSIEEDLWVNLLGTSLAKAR